ncbi:MAG: LysR family transcriptional regulator [Streptosporangiaceae bacterium]
MPTQKEPVLEIVAGGARRATTPQGVELRHLRYFVAVADAGTFTQAAEHMFIAQPTLSQQIRRLEEMVGTPLLRRCREGVRLTAAGSVLLEESRALLSMMDHGVRRTRAVAGLGRPSLRIAIPPGLPDALAVETASRLRDRAAAGGVDIMWLELSLDAGFSLIRKRRADAGLGWLASADEELPASLDVMSLGDFEPEAWIPAPHPAASRGVISVSELASLDVVHGPRRASPATYDAWLAVLRATDPRFEFTDPPFRQSLAMTLAFAAAGSQPAAVLTGPLHAAGTPGSARAEEAASSHGLIPVRLEGAPLAATVGLVWNGDLPRHLQQLLFDTADGLTLGAAAVAS